MNFYINEQGNTVFTAQYHRKKGSCCHSNCLHCPYGTTLKNIGLQLHQSHSAAKKLFDQLYVVSDRVTSDLLASAFGGKEPKEVFDPEIYKVFSLKEVPCGLLKIRDQKLISYKLLESFSQQGINEGHITSLVQDQYNKPDGQR